MPFQLEDASQPIAKHIKLALFGPPGTGKTHIALGFPGCVVVDTEAGTDFFRGRPGIPAFQVLKTKSYAQVMELLDAIEAGKLTCGTLVIDSLTILNDVLRESAFKMAEKRAVSKNISADDYTVTPRDWGKIKAKINSLMTRLYNAPCSTVLTGWIKDVYEGEGNDLKKVGTTLDADKKVLYQPDIVLELAVVKGKHVAYVRKDRTGTWPVDTRLTDVSYEHTFRPLVERIGAGPIAEVRMATEEEAAEDGAEEFATAGPEVRALRAVLTAKGLTDQDGAVLIGAKLHRPIPSLTVLSPAEARKMSEGIDGTDAEALRGAVERLTSKEIA